MYTCVLTFALVLGTGKLRDLFEYVIEARGNDLETI